MKRGNSSIVLKGKGAYANTSKTVHYKVRVGTVPDLQNLGEYRPGPYGSEPTNLVVNFKVKASAKTYRDIKIPEGWEWYPNDVDSLKYKTIQDLDDRFREIPRVNVDLSQPWEPQFKGSNIELNGPKSFDVSLPSK